MENLQKRELLVPKTWIQAVAVVVLFGFFVLGLLAYRTYSGEAPIPARVVDPGGILLFTHDDTVAGQQVFLRNGLMEYGSIFGHGAYLGPDYTADYLRRSASSVYEAHGGQKSESANSQTVAEFKTNRYDPSSDTLIFTEAQGRTAAGQISHAVPALLGGNVPGSGGLWNFLGAGVFGFLINLPVVSYYEIGTALTTNHGHAAMMGVYGMLAAGLALFCIRYLIPEERWLDRAAKVSFWSLNLGLAWMVFATLFPLGLLQLYESVNHGYFEARSLKFLTSDANAFLEWLRLPGDVLCIAGGVLPLVYLCWLGIRHTVPRSSTGEPETVLFAEVSDS